jgi:hypothetical protein
MAFDDLAKHMASRDRKRLSKAASADELVAEVAAADRKMARQRDLILGPLLLLGGVLAAVFLISLELDTNGGTTNMGYVERKQSLEFLALLSAITLALLGFGIRQTYRGLRNRSHLAPADEATPLDVAFEAAQKRR